MELSLSDDAVNNPSIEQVLQQSQAAVAESNAGKPGRPPKYASDEERRNARRLQNREYKRQKYQTERAPVPEGEERQERRPRRQEPPKPAGLAPFLAPAFDMPIGMIRTEFGLSPEELPGLEDEVKAELATQADLQIGIFFPDAADNRWVALSAFLGGLGAVYFDVFQKAKALAAEKAARSPSTVDPMAANSIPVQVL